MNKRMNKLAMFIGEGRALHQVLREDERLVHRGEHQLETTTTQARYFKSEYKYIWQRLENQHPYATGSEVFEFFKFILPLSEGNSTTTFKALAKHREGPINSLTDALASWERNTTRVNVGANSGTPCVQRDCQQRHDVNADAKG
jgi:hypothetical protein